MKIRLNLWLEREFFPPPAMRTASRWIKQGKIYPPPIKVGNAYYVEEKAIYQEGNRPLRLAERLALEEIEERGQSKRAKQARSTVGSILEKSLHLRSERSALNQ
ncbi:excisionase [Burkholderia sp. MSMB1072]|uniref:excisionase n=1 Tax=Burkholderia sp. MSMB1072 TaxID=1637871 RepID=UPI0009EB9350|nr:excisionase [Burkholderia sp. MSMB1072]